MGTPPQQLATESRRHNTYRCCSPAETAGGVYSPRPPKRSCTCRRPGAQHPESARRHTIARGPGSVHALGSTAAIRPTNRTCVALAHRRLAISQLSGRIRVNLMALTTGLGSAWLLRRRHAGSCGAPPWHACCRTHPRSALRGSPPPPQEGGGPAACGRPGCVHPARGQERGIHAAPNSPARLPGNCSASRQAGGAAGLLTRPGRCGIFDACHVQPNRRRPPRAMPFFTTSNAVPNPLRTSTTAVTSTCATSTTAAWSATPHTTGPASANSGSLLRSASAAALCSWRAPPLAGAVCRRSVGVHHPYMASKA